MSTVIPFGGGTHTANGVVLAHQLDTEVPAKLLKVSPDYKRSCIWTKISANAPAYMSQGLINDLNSSCKAIKGLPSSPYRYRVLLSERPSIFCLGGDLALFRACIESRDRGTLVRYARSAVDAVWESLSGSGYQNLTSIALVQGEAQGGGFEAALASHILVAEKGSHFGLPESLFGLFPGMGASPLLHARSDTSVAKSIIGSARRYSADELLELGVVDFVAEPGCGVDYVRNLIGSGNHDSFSKYRKRFLSISKTDLITTVDDWVEQALSLDQKHLRSMGYLIQAQRKAIARLN